LDLTVYHGWKIYTHVGKVQPNRIRDLKCKIESWFDQGEWSFEDKYRTIITNEKFDSKIEVIINGEPTEFEESLGLNNYSIVFKSDFFGFRNESPHQVLCDKVSHKITWKKQAYYLINDEWVPVSKKRILKIKKR